MTAGGSYTHDITVEGDPEFNIAVGQTMTQSGLISDGGTPGTIEVTGGGTLALTNTANSYSGGTTVTEGSTVSIGADGALGNAAGGATLGDTTSDGTLALTATLTSARGITLGDGGGTIDTASGATGTLSGVLIGDGRLTKTGAGTLVLTGANNYAGGTTVSAGILQGTTTSLQGDILDDANVTFDQNTIGTYSDTISGSGGVTKAGDGTVTFTGANGYTGATTVDAGTLRLDPGGSLASTTALTINRGFFFINNGGQTVGGLSGGSGGALLLANGDLTVNQAGTSSFGGLITSAGGLPIEGGGTLALGNASNNYGGGTTVIGGSTVSIATGGALGVSFGGLTLGDATTSGTLATTATLSLAQPISLGAGGGRVDVADGTTATLSSTIGDAGGLTKTGAGTLILTNFDNYTGGTTIDGGTLRLGIGGSLGGTGALIVNGGTFDIESGFEQTVGSLSGTANGTVTLGNGSFTVDQSTTTSFAGSIGGTGGLTKSGAGTLILTGTNDYTGITGVSAGRLELGPGGSLAPSSSLFITGGIFDLENGGQTVGGLVGFNGSVNLGNGSLIVDQAAPSMLFASSIGGPAA